MQASGTGRNRHDGHAPPSPSHPSSRRSIPPLTGPDRPTEKFRRLRRDFSDEKRGSGIIRARRDPGFPGGILITNPIPEEGAIPGDVIDAAIEQALREAEEQGVRGKEITPFRPAKVSEITGGDSLKSNIRPLLNNVRPAGRIACALQA